MACWHLWFPTLATTTPANEGLFAGPRQSKYVARVGHPVIGDFELFAMEMVGVLVLVGVCY